MATTLAKAIQDLRAYGEKRESEMSDLEKYELKVIIAGLCAIEDGAKAHTWNPNEKMETP